MLLDALLALGLTVIVVLTCVSLFVSSLAAQEVAKQQTVATHAARKVVENLRAFQQSGISTGIYSDASVFGPIPPLQQLTDSRADLTITPVRGTLKRAVVNVHWQSGIPRRIQSLTIATFLATEGVLQ